MQEEIELALTKGILNSLERTAQETGINVGDLATGVLSRVLTEIAENSGGESLLVTLRLTPEGWMSHFHLDYLDADPEHLKKDFYWGRDPGQENT